MSKTSKNLHIKIEHLEYSEIKITSWKNGFDIFFLSNGEWVKPYVLPNIDLFSCDGIITNDQLSISSIPSEVVNLLHPFKHHQLDLLLLIHLNENAYELFLNNSLLLWLVACHANKHTYSIQKLNSLIKKKQKDILYDLFGIRDLKAVKFLRKIVSGGFFQKDYLVLKKAFESDSLIEALKHYENVPMRLILVLLDYPFLLKSKTLDYWIEKSFLKNNNCEKEVLKFEKDWNACRLAGRVLRLEQMNKYICNCQTPKELKNLLRKWNKRKELSLNYLNAKRSAVDEETLTTEQILENQKKAIKKNATRKNKSHKR